MWAFNDFIERNVYMIQMVLKSKVYHVLMTEGKAVEKVLHYVA